MHICLGSQLSKQSIMTLRSFLGIPSLGLCLIVIGLYVKPHVLSLFTDRLSFTCAHEMVHASLCACRGFIYMLLFSKWLLPDSEATSLHDEVLVGLQIPKGSKHTGRTGVSLTKKCVVFDADSVSCSDEESLPRL